MIHTAVCFGLKMVQRCSGKIAKFLLFAFNFIFLLTSIGILAIGGLGQYYLQKSGHTVGQNYLSVPIGLIVIGGVIFILAFFGCYGATYESYAMLMIFVVLITILLVIEVVVGFMFYTNQERVLQITQMNLKKTMADYWKTSELNPAKYTWDFMQEKLECCGVKGPADWLVYRGLPESCGRPLYHRKGCFEAVREKLNEFSNHAMTIGILLSAIQAIAICLACTLANQ